MTAEMSINKAVGRTIMAHYSYQAVDGEPTLCSLTT
jgi:hypothetical protein